MFGVLTHADQIDIEDTTFLEFERRFKNGLGLTKLRYLLCQNYCDDILRNDHRNPQVEVPLMIFLKQVIK